jgi:hypothetical protein
MFYPKLDELNNVEKVFPPSWRFYDQDKNQTHKTFLLP